jgi:hypothetical protein
MPGTYCGAVDEWLLCPAGIAPRQAHPEMDYADYERRLTSLQMALHLIQRAYSAPRTGGDPDLARRLSRRYIWCTCRTETLNLNECWNAISRGRTFLPRGALAFRSRTM